MSLELIYTTTTKGAMTFTGNTSGLSQDAYVNEPGTVGSIGAFTSLNPKLKVPFFAYGDYGTTLNYEENGSDAKLVIPKNSTVLFAQLIWGGLYHVDYDGSTILDLSDLLDQSVTFTTPDDVAYEIVPDTKYTSDSRTTSVTNLRKIYTNTAIVTDIVSNAGGGMYSVEKIVGTTMANTLQTGQISHVGWTLAVIYADDSLPERSMTLWNGNELITSTVGSYADIEISGFTTPKAGEFTTRLLLSAQEGDANLTGDSLLFGKDTDSLVKISGPNNPEDNFFASQINDDDGLLDENGSFHELNADAFTGENTSGGRQGWDITNIDVSEHMTNLQTEAVLRMTTDGDIYALNAIGLQVDVLTTDTELTITNAVDKTETYDLEILTYTVIVENVGRSTATAIVLDELLDSTLTYVASSLTIDGVADEKQTPNDSISLADIESGNSVTITFQALTGENYDEAFSIENTAVVNYVSPDDPSTTLTETSNEVETIVVGRGITVTKSADTTLAKIGDTIMYTVEIINRSNGTLADLVLTDVLGDSVEFIENTVTIDGVVTENVTPETGIALSDLSSKESIVVTFQVFAVAENQEFPNIATSNYIKILQNISINQTTNSEEVKIMILGDPINTVTKLANLTIAEIGDTITFTVVFENTSDLTLSDVVFTDAYDTGYDFVSSSVAVNGATDPTADISKFTIGTVDAFATTTITYDMVLNESATNPLENIAGIYYTITDPDTGESLDYALDSNPVTVTVEETPTPAEANVTLEKSVDDTLVAVGDVVTYTLVVANEGSVTLENITVYDVLPADLSFVAGSVKVDNELRVDDNFLSGIAIATLAVGAVSTITFEAEIAGKSADTIANIATVNADYTSGSDIFTVTANSNEVILTVILPELTIQKSANEKSVSLDEIVKYTILLTNTGEINFNEVTLFDTLPEAMEFVADSLTLNGIVVNGAEVADGFVIGKITVDEVVEITYKAKVLSGTCDSKLENSAYATYEYIFSDDEKGTGTTETATASITADISNFKQIALNSQVSIPPQKPDLQSLDDTTATIEITDFYVIRVIEGVSNEGQRLFGHKLVAHGEVHASIEYTSCFDSVFSAHWDIPFTAYIVLPKDYHPNKKIDVRGIIENVSARELDARNLDIGTLALIVASIQ